MLDLESLNKAINEMASSKKITIFARGFSEFIATEMQTKILLLGKYCDLYTDPNIIRPISKNLILIHLSYLFHLMEKLKH